MHTKRPHYVPKTYLGARANSALLLGASAVTVPLAENREEFFQKIEEEWAGLRQI